MSGLMMTFLWRWLGSSPACHNEHLKLELSRDWEPLDSPRPLPNNKGKKTHDGFPYGNQAEKS
jgi:hypothetical protein